MGRNAKSEETFDWVRKLKNFKRKMQIKFIRKEL
jgi:hypothetical protein